MEKKKSEKKADRAKDTSKAKKTYRAPRVEKKKSAARVTLFSGGGATAGGLTASG